MAKGEKSRMMKMKRERIKNGKRKVKESAILASAGVNEFRFYIK